MAKKYDIHSFSYIDNENGVNTLNGTSGKEWEEVWEEYPVVCFNGLAYYKATYKDNSVHCFIMTYPKFNELSLEDKHKVENYCGFVPEAGEYGVVCGAFGVLKEITEKQFKEVMRDYPIKKEDYKELPWLG